MPTNFAKMESAFIGRDQAETSYAYGTVPVGHAPGQMIVVAEAASAVSARQFSAVPDDEDEDLLVADVEGLHAVQLLCMPTDPGEKLPDSLSIYTWARAQVPDGEGFTTVWATLEAEPTVLYTEDTATDWLAGQGFLSPVIELAGCWDRLTVEIVEAATYGLAILVTPAQAVSA